MKVIVASFAKCGTKTLHKCLEHLGYSVYDYDSNFLYLEPEWTKIFKYGSTTEQFRKMYEDVDAVCDLPACYYWEEIHKAFPNAQIIFTARAVEDWLNSWDNQLKVIEGNHLLNLMGIATWTGIKYFRYYRLMGRLIFGCPHQSPLTWFRHTNQEIMKRRYREHNDLVLLRAPKDKLLVFNFSDGWKPLCDFLGRDVPDIPFPRENVGGAEGKNKTPNRMVTRFMQELYISMSILAAIFAFFSYYLLAKLFQ